MILVGPGPGPKNVLLELLDGRKTVVTYRTWKQIKEKKMAGEKKTYPVFSGLIQQFGDNPAVVTRDANGQSVRDVTIKAVGSQKLIRLTVWPEYAGVEFGKGYKMEGEGALTVSEGKDGKTYYNISVSTLLPPIAPLPKADKQVVNATAAAAGSEDEDAPF